MEMPEGWKTLERYRDCLSDRNLPNLTLSHTESLDLMKEMAECIERILEYRNALACMRTADQRRIEKVYTDFLEWK